MNSDSNCADNKNKKPVLLSGHRAFSLPFPTVMVLGLVAGLAIIPSSPVFASPQGKVLDRALFFEVARKKFHKGKISPNKNRNGVTIVEGYTALLEYWDSRKDLTDLRWLAYVLGTQETEAAHQERPIKECFHISNNDEKIARCLETLITRGVVKKRYWFKHPNGFRYFGRGFVQITHGYNYKKMGKELGLNGKLYNNPNLTINLDIATKILYVGMVKGLFRKDKKGKKYTLARFFQPGVSNRFQWIRARNIVNYRLHADRIARDSRIYLTGLKYVAAPDAPPEEPPVTPEPPVIPGDDTADTPDEEDVGTKPPSTGNENTSDNVGSGVPGTGETPGGGPGADAGTQTPDSEDTDVTDDGQTPVDGDDNGTITPGAGTIDTDGPGDDDSITLPISGSDVPEDDQDVLPPLPPDDDDATPGTGDIGGDGSSDGTTSPPDVIDIDDPEDNDQIGTTPPDTKPVKKPWWKRLFTSLRNSIWKWKR